MLKTFKVTKEILQKSVKCLKEDMSVITQCCALATAIREQYPSAVVWLSSARIGNYGLNGVVELSKEAIKYRESFDTASSMEERLELPEFEFQLDIPDGI